VISEDACDARPTGIGNEKRSPHQMHPPQGEMVDWSHSQMLFASGPKGSLGDPDARTNFGKIKWPIRMFLYELLELLHNRLTAAGTSLMHGCGCALSWRSRRETLICTLKHSLISHSVDNCGQTTITAMRSWGLIFVKALRLAAASEPAI
jgi:hypothetical protein